MVLEQDEMLKGKNEEKKKNIKAPFDAADVCELQRSSIGIKSMWSVMGHTFSWQLLKLSKPDSTQIGGTCCENLSIEIVVTLQSSTFGRLKE